MKMRVILTGLAMAMALAVSAKGLNTAALDSLRSYLACLDARVGVAVVADSCIFEYRSDECLPMMSVVKFPLALAVAEKLRRDGNSLDITVPVEASQLRTDTYSPMLKRYPAGKPFRTTVRELLEYSLAQSDNNACDILIDYIGGIDSLRSCKALLGRDGIEIHRTEADMYADVMSSYDNCATAAALAGLLRDFDVKANDPLSREIKNMMEQCVTGDKRLPSPLRENGTVIGHKTGTGPINPHTGRIMAINDAGYVHLPQGTSYAIAVLVADTPYDMATNEAIIARISAYIRDAVAK